MLAEKPFLVRAMFDWIVASECTPYVKVDTAVSYVSVPQQYVTNNQIILNIAPMAVKDLSLDNRYISFDARFSGEHFHVYIPIKAVKGIYAKENGRGIMFDEDSGEDNHDMMEPVSESEVLGQSAKKHKGSKASNHLKVIK
jgi:stringent starvation protein B